jgi:hypothetical protein
MDRHWLITWTCYGTWLPGDARGFVGNVRDQDGSQVSHNLPGTPFDADIPPLEAFVREHMKGSPVYLDKADSEALIAQYCETAIIREWTLHAASVMHNHTHVVVGVSGDPGPAWILETLKSWATRALKKRRVIPTNGSFWTAKGSKRKLPNHDALTAAVVYVVKKQPNPLAVYSTPLWQETLEAFERTQRE